MSALLAIRKARPLDEYPPLRLVPERRLREIERVEPCACGTRIYQLVGDGIRETLEAHQATEAHQTWRKAGDAPTAATGPVDVSVSRGGASGRPLPEVAS